MGKHEPEFPPKRNSVWKMAPESDQQFEDSKTLPVGSIAKVWPQIWGGISGWLFLSLPCKWSLLSQEQYCQRRGLVAEPKKASTGNAWENGDQQMRLLVGVRFRWSFVETAQFTMRCILWSSTWRSLRFALVKGVFFVVSGTEWCTSQQRLGVELSRLAPGHSFGWHLPTLN